VDKYPLRPEYTGLNEPDLVARCQAGDLEAFNVLISRHETRVLNMALRYLRDYHQALDETQEIFLKVFRKIRLFKGRSAFATWLYRITANHCLNVIKINRGPGAVHRHAVSLDEAREENFQEVLKDEAAPKPDEASAMAELRNTIAELLEKLPDQQRQVILLCHFEHMSYEEIAEVLEVPVTTIRSCLHRARQQLKRLFAMRGVRWS
jgi:RNA polymerase sigma-70 factor, ECF subfamily